MPDLACLFRQGDPGRLCRGLRRIEEAQFHFGGVLREERKVNSTARVSGAERRGLARPKSYVWRTHHLDAGDSVIMAFLASRLEHHRTSQLEVHLFPRGDGITRA